MKIDFPLPGRKQLKALFIRMYCRASTSTYGQSSGASTKDDASTPEHSLKSAEKVSTDLTIKADEFVNALPEDSFSAADIQGFLLTWKNDIVGALEAVTEWVENHRCRKSKERQQGHGALATET